MGQITYENLDEQLQNQINSGGSGIITLPISANDITELPEKVFVSSQEKAEIMASTNENASQTARIANIENTLATISTSDEKVAMDGLSVAGYLSELIDGLTITNVNGKLQVQNLNNLLSTIQELNSLQGVSSNIQQQINNLQGVSSFRGVFASLQELQSASSPQSGQYAIVSTATASEYYFFYNSMWEYSHSTNSATGIDINSGTIGTLSKMRYEHQNASETQFTDSTGKITASNANDAIIEVFRFADSLLKGLTQTVGSPLSSVDTIETNLRNFKNWYANVAEAIVSKGVMASSANNGDEIIQKIKSIPNISIEGTVKKKSRINVSAGGNIEIQLTSSISLSDITTTLIEFVAGTSGLVKYTLGFDNGDSADFEPNNYVEFNGVMRLKTNYEYDMIPATEWSSEGSVSRYGVDRNIFIDIKKLNVKNKGV